MPSVIEEEASFKWLAKVNEEIGGTDSVERLLFIVSQGIEICDDHQEPCRNHPAIRNALRKLLKVSSSFKEAFEAAMIGKKYHENEHRAGCNRRFGLLMMEDGLKKAVFLTRSHKEAIQVYTFAESIDFTGKAEVCDYALSKATYLNNEETLLNSHVFRSYIE